MLPNNTQTRQAVNSNPLADVAAHLPESKKGVCENRGVPFEELEDKDRASDKSRLLQFLTYNPKGVRLSRVVKAVLPEEGDKKISERTYSTTDYNLAARFFERTEYVEISKEGGAKTASPTAAAFHLTTVSKIPTDHMPGFAKDRAEALASTIWDLNDVKDARMLVKDYTKYLTSIQDKRLMLQSDQTADKLTMPYHTRFNNDSRKDEQWAKYKTAWDIADAKYKKGVMLTLTTDPKRYDSIGAMLDGLMDGWTQLQEALNQKFGGDQRLDFIRALEFGGSEKSDHIGLPHLHVAVFGVPYIDQEWLSNYWQQRQAEVVHVSGMNKRGSESWVMHGSQHSGKSAAGYLGKYLSKTFESIGDRPDDLLEEVENWEEGGDWASSGLWKIALYWATGRQFWASSHDLKDRRPDPDRLEDMPQLGDRKLERLNDAEIHTLSDVRLADLDELAAIEGISRQYAERMKKIVGEASPFDLLTFTFVGAASLGDMPTAWTEGNTRHYGASI